MLLALRWRIGRWRLAAAPVLLLLALAPSVLYVGHWGDFFATARPVSPEHMAQHAAHCHIGPSSCSDQPAPAGVTLLGYLVELEEPQLTATVLEDGLSASEGVFVSPPKQPPRL